MKLKSTLFFCFLFFFGYAQQRVDWLSDLGSPSHDRAYDVASDASGNIYVTGYFQGTTDFDPSTSSTTNLVSNGSTDIFIAKYSTTNQLLWAVSIGGSSADEGTSIAVDATGSVYVTGSFQGANVDFDAGAGSNLLSSNGGQDIFLVKYNTSGVFQSALNIGGSEGTIQNGIVQEDIGRAVAVDGSNNVYITGSFIGTNINFNPSGSNLYSSTPSSGGTQDYTDIFVSKYNSSLAYQWTSTYGFQYRDEGSTITIDGSDNVYVGGIFAGAIDFDNGVGFDVLTSSGLASAFVAKYSSANVYQDAFEIGGSGTFDIVGVADITTDGTSSIYITGGFSSTNGADFNPSGGGTLTSPGVTPGQNSDIFVAKYSLALAYDWAFNVGAIENVSSALAIAVDASSVYVTGSFKGSMDFDPDAGAMNILTSAGLEDIFVGKYDNSTGAHQEAFSVGSSNDDLGSGILVDGSGNIFVTGYFNGSSIDFDPATNVAAATTNGSDDIFIVKYYPTEQPLPVELIDFRGELTASGVLLNWETATEENNSHFDIEWSKDGKSFEKVGLTEGFGTTPEQQSYSFLHKGANSGENYYRLKQVDYDGQFEYTPTIMVEVEGRLRNNPRIYPNPAKSYLFVDVNEEVNCQIIDLMGRVIRTYQLRNGTSIDISALASGTYLIKIGEKTQKFVVE